MYLKFWIKTALYRWIPGGFGYQRYLRRYRDRGYVHERDKHPLRFKHWGDHGWKQQEAGEGITYRDYADYKEYVMHQKQKWDEGLKISGGHSNQTIAASRRKYFHRFVNLRRLLPTNACIVCAGARDGTEVEVLRDLGFVNAYGIDLNPGPNNSFVRYGDFMHMDNQTCSVDLIYTNSVDHAFNLADFFSEHARVIKDGGYVMYDLSLGATKGPFEAVTWEVEGSLFLMMLCYFRTIVHVETEKHWKWILLQGKRKS